MASECRKKCKNQIKERSALSARIIKCGIEMLPCSFCKRNDKKCIVSGEGSTRCSECAQGGKKCDVEGLPVNDWESLEREEQRIEHEREATLAKLLRLDKQQRFLKRQGREMLKRGLKSLDELDAAEEKERDEAAHSPNRTTPTASASESALGILEMSPSSWDQFLVDIGVGAGGRTPPLTHG
jgi:hypothetical protein